MCRVIYTGDLLVAQTVVEEFHVNVTVKRYSPYASMTSAVEKRGVLTGTVERQLHILKNSRRNGTLQAFKCF